MRERSRITPRRASLYDTPLRAQASMPRSISLRQSRPFRPSAAAQCHARLLAASFSSFATAFDARDELAPGY